ncbi:hypothetical protein [Streptomyces lydicus]|uniref:hypothetical protein n=1 Tax=Streptomyces lydicus TaxID=47763 RepID=UPI00368338B8
MLLSGCAQQDDHEAPSADGATGAVRAPRTQHPSQQLPIAAYALSAEEDALVAKAEQQLTRACAKRFSVDYEPPGAGDKGAVGRDEDRRYGVVDAKLASAYGYHLPPDPKAPPVHLSSSQRIVLLGQSVDGARVERFRGEDLPEGGCTGEARQKARGDFASEDLSGIAGGIDAGSFRPSMEEPEVKAALGQWSQCMARRGHDYATPLDSVGDRRFGDESASKGEREVAEADVDCKMQTGLIEHWVAGESRLQRAAIKKNAAQLGKLKEQQRREIRYARTVLKKGTARP